MKKIKIIIISIFFLLIVFYFGFDYRKNTVSKTYYRVYYKNEFLGTISSKKEFNNYINKMSDIIKKQYNVETVYAPEGTNIKKIVSYNEKVTSIKNMYNKIIAKSPLTIDGYLVKIKKELSDEEDSNKAKYLKLYLIDKSILNDAINNFIYTYVGKDNYVSYMDKAQKEIKDTGSLLENVYIENEITTKRVKISTQQKIYTDSTELSKYFVFGTTNVQNSYIVKQGDSIESVAYNNKISVDEFLISNPTYTSATNILLAGDTVQIGETNPQLNAVIETYQVEDTVSKYKQEVRIDKNMYVGQENVIQDGVDGVDRVTQRIKYINGNIVYVEPVNTEELKSSIAQIVVKGDKYASNIGNLKYWSWPTINGWTISDGYYYRINPITGLHEHHSGIDIAGTGYGSPVYAANNGTVITKAYEYDYGYYIIINHNNGYWTVYAHLSRFANINVGSTVTSGQIIGYVGSTGWSTGPHLHFEVRKGNLNGRISPWSIYGS